MIHFHNSYLRITSQEVQLRKLSFLEIIMALVYLFKYMLKILFLDLLMKIFAINFKTYAE